MYVGYGIVTQEQFSDIHNTLRDFGCRHVFIDDISRNRKSHSGFQKALSKLGDNDILIIQHIEHLSNSDSFLIDHLHTLIKKKIHLQVLADNFFLCWDTRDPLLLLALLKKFQQRKRQAQVAARKQTLSLTGKKAGANTKITPEIRDEIFYLLSRKHTLTEICDRVKISKGTFRNHFGTKKEALKKLDEIQAKQKFYCS